MFPLLFFFCVVAIKVFKKTTPNGKLNILVLSYLPVIRSKTYRGYVKPRIIPNAIYNVIFM
jgi:hypothetical protein